MRRKKQTRLKILPILILIIIVLSSGFVALLMFAPNKLVSNQPINATSTNALSDTAIHSKAAILVKNDNLEVVAQKNESEKIFPASLTKIMTTILLIELLDDFDQHFTMTEDIANQNQLDDASTAGLTPYESLSAIDLLYSIMLPSGADGVLTLIYGLGYDEASFAQLMNQKAKELGMNQTHFTNPSGFHDPNHYTTVYDMAKLLQYALKNKTFKTIFTTEAYTTQANEYSPYGHYLMSTTFSKLETTYFSWGQILGGKTGYTPESGLNLATLAIDNQHQEYLLITANANGTLTSKPYHFLDAYYIYGKYLSN